MIISPLLAWGIPSGGELIFIFAIILLIFGGKKLPELARALGLAKKEFHKATKEASDEWEKIKETPPEKPFPPSTSSPSNSHQNGDSSKKV